MQLEQSNQSPKKKMKITYTKQQNVVDKKGRKRIIP